MRAMRVADGHMRPDCRRNPLRACHQRKHQPHAAEQRPDAPRPRLIRIGDPHLNLDLVVQPVFERHEFHFGRQSTPCLCVQNCRISHANSFHDDWVSVSSIKVPAKTELTQRPNKLSRKTFARLPRSLRSPGSKWRIRSEGGPRLALRRRLRER